KVDVRPPDLRYILDSEPLLDLAALRVGLLQRLFAHDGLQLQEPSQACYVVQMNARVVPEIDFATFLDHGLDGKGARQRLEQWPRLGDRSDHVLRRASHRGVSTRVLDELRGSAIHLAKFEPSVWNHEVGVSLPQARAARQTALNKSLADGIQPGE